jgi:hypothetical protein
MEDMNRLGDLILKHWTTHRPELIEELEKDEPVADRAAPGAGTDGRSSLQSDGGSEDGVPRGLGAGDAGMGVPSARPGAALPGPPGPSPLGATPTGSSIVRQADPEPDPVPSRDFRITDSDRIGEGSLRDKAFDNIEAIRTLKRIEAESRAATGAEKSLLVKYTGWGAMANAFRPYPPSEWQHTAAELHELLTPPEYESARASTPNAHFTSPLVVRAVWQAMLRFGLQPGAQILEPSMGVGHFLGLMPEELVPGSRYGPASNSTPSPPGLQNASIQIRRSSPRAWRRRRCPTISSTA